MALLSDFSYSEFTQPPLNVTPDRDYPSLENLVEPDTLPVILKDIGSPLVKLQGRNITVLTPYWDTGWEHAVEETWVRQDVLNKLIKVAAGLPKGFGITVFDAWRPLALQQEIYELAYADDTLPEGFVSVPSQDPTSPPPHQTGGTVDVTLTHMGDSLALGTEFDDFTDKAATSHYEQLQDYDPELPIRNLRRMLCWHMRQQDFIVLKNEWWHFETGTARWAGIRGKQPIYQGVAPFS